jgi:hypothetical protein
LATTIIVAGFAKEARGSWRRQVVPVVIAQSINSAALTGLKMAGCCQAAHAIYALITINQFI